MVRTSGSGGGVDLAALDGDLLPDSDNLRKIGSAAKRWAALYSVLAFISALYIGSMMISELGPGWLLINGSTYVNGTLNVTGDLNVYGNITLECILIKGHYICEENQEFMIINGSTKVNGTLNVTQNLTVAGESFFEKNVTIRENLTVDMVFLTGGKVEFDPDRYLKWVGTTFFLRGGGIWLQVSDRTPIKVLYSQVQNFVTASFNEGGGDWDFRIESDDQPYMFFVNANDNVIGINNSLPVETFDISGSLGMTQNMTDGTWNVSAYTGYLAYNHTSSMGEDHTWLDQDVTKSATPQFSELTIDKNSSFGDNISVAPEANMHGGVSYYAMYYNILDETADHLLVLRIWQDESVTVFVLQPDVPRDITVTVSPELLGIVQGTVTINGTDADGYNLTETLTFNTWIVETQRTNFAYATVNSVDIDQTDAGVLNLYAVGIGNKIGYQNYPWEDANDVIKVAMNTRHTESYTVAVEYGTIDLTVVDIQADDNLAVWWRPWKD